MSQVYNIQGLDPLLFGDGRPFGNVEGALVAEGLPLPLPGTLAGALRTKLGLLNPNFDFRDDVSRARLLDVPVWGPVLTVNDVPVVAAPSDLIPMDKGGELAILRSRPTEVKPGEGMNLPDGLLPCFPEVFAGMKPTKKSGPRFLTLAQFEEWVLDGKISGDPPLKAIPMEQRVHVAIQHDSKASAKGQLYQTRGSCLGSILDAGEAVGAKMRTLHLGLLCQLGENLGLESSDVLTLGGERRLASLSPGKPWPAASDRMRNSLVGAKRVMLTLATPADFGGTFRPGWESPPGAPNLKLKLVSALCRRSEPVSGWDLAKRGPKAVRWLAPAGAVYFFDVLEGDPSVLADLWLHPVSNEEQSRRDGYGLALWGPW
jgi:CRISPR-associated protein Cmr3